MTEIAEIQEQIAALEVQMAGTSLIASTFEDELARMRDGLTLTGREVAVLTNGIGGGLRRAFDGLVFDGMKLGDALRQVARSMADAMYGIAMRPVQQALGGAVAKGLGALMGGLMPFQQGAGFAQGRVMPFAKGGVVSRPVAFPMRSGAGLMGEAGPEAIMPLARGADGRLGVQASGAARSVTVVMNIQTPDVQGFQRSKSQIAAQAQRMLAHGMKNR